MSEPTVKTTATKSTKPTATAKPGMVNDPDRANALHGSSPADKKPDDNSKLAAAIDSVVEQPKETKSDKFRRLAVNRVPRVVKLLNMLKNLANKNVYDYTDEQRDKVLSVVGESYRQFKAAFEQLSQKDTGFTL